MASSPMGQLEFHSMLPPWDNQVPNMELAADRTKATSQYYGFEAVPGKVGFIRDFVKLGPDGVEEHLPEALCVPQNYWVSLCIIDWSTSIHQYLHSCMVELAGSSSNKARKAACVEFESVRAEIQSGTQVDVVGSLNELVWREWNNWIEVEVPVEETSSGATVQKMAFGALFISNGGFIASEDDWSEDENVMLYLWPDGSWPSPQANMAQGPSPWWRGGINVDRLQMAKELSVRLLPKDSRPKGKAKSKSKTRAPKDTPIPKSKGKGKLKVDPTSERDGEGLPALEANDEQLVDTMLKVRPKPKQEPQDRHVGLAERKQQRSGEWLKKEEAKPQEEEEARRRKEEEEEGEKLKAENQKRKEERSRKVEEERRKVEEDHERQRKRDEEAKRQEDDEARRRKEEEEEGEAKGGKAEAQGRKVEEDHERQRKRDEEAKRQEDDEARCRKEEKEEKLKAEKRKRKDERSRKKEEERRKEVEEEEEEEKLTAEKRKPKAEREEGKRQAEEDDDGRGREREMDSKTQEEEAEEDKMEKQDQSRHAVEVNGTGMESDEEGRQKKKRGGKQPGRTKSGDLDGKDDGGEDNGKLLSPVDRDGTLRGHALGTVIAWVEEQILANRGTTGRLEARIAAANQDQESGGRDKIALARSEINRLSSMQIKARADLKEYSTLHEWIAEHVLADRDDTITVEEKEAFKERVLEIHPKALDSPLAVRNASNALSSLRQGLPKRSSMQHSAAVTPTPSSGISKRSHSTPDKVAKRQKTSHPAKEDQAPAVEMNLKNTVISQMSSRAAQHPTQRRTNIEILRDPSPILYRKGRSSEQSSECQEPKVVVSRQAMGQEQLRSMLAVLEPIVLEGRLEDYFGGRNTDTRGLQVEGQNSEANLLRRLVDFVDINIEDRLRTVVRLCGPMNDRVLVRDGFPPGWRPEIGVDYPTAVQHVTEKPGELPLEDYILGQNQLKLASAIGDLVDLAKTAKRLKEPLAGERLSTSPRDSKGSTDRHSVPTGMLSMEVGPAVKWQASTVKNGKGRVVPLHSRVSMPPEVGPCAQRTSIDTSDFWGDSGDPLGDIGGGSGQDGADIHELFMIDMAPPSESTPAFSSPPMPPLQLCYDYPTTLAGLIRTALDDMHFITSEINATETIDLTEYFLCWGRWQDWPIVKGVLEEWAGTQRVKFRELSHALLNKDVLARIHDDPGHPPKLSTGQ
ncbi:hypothetical protein FIBSPDRAFT_902316 [Athelia psychrophila]|uniref:Uncharacterized protein n=1 Tax=Athelia psychrophila TaxID=1759441 RepID=A0A167XCW0_9AGAM|nr:hypothetical protein FIBSPDRAFT_902316 [Fibularhizoctonia sp. CBS 109695]